MPLEDALAKTEADAENALRAATAATRAVKKFRSAAQSGNLRELPKAIEAAEQTIAALREQFLIAKKGWIFDSDGYLSSGTFASEIVDMATRQGVKIFEQEDRLYCHPLLVRVLPGERQVLIDKTRERRLRPSILVGHLRELQNKPPRFKPDTFLKCLFSAYSISVAKRGKHLVGTEPAVPLLEVYELLTLLPGQSKDYTRQEFARDIYLLDKSGMTETGDGHHARFPAATGTKSASKTISVITDRGHQKVYYAIAFGRHG